MLLLGEYLSVFRVESSVRVCVFACVYVCVPVCLCADVFVCASICACAGMWVCHLYHAEIVQPFVFGTEGEKYLLRVIL